MAKDRNGREAGTRHGLRGAALALALALAGCGSDEPLAISGPTTANSTIVDLPAGPVSDSAAILERRLRAAGVSVTAIDRQSGFIRARSQDTRFVDCGRIFETVNGDSRDYPGNAPRLVLTDPAVNGSTLLRLLSADTSAGIGITQGVTNTVVVRQQHRVTIEIRSGDGRRVISSATREFSDRGFAQFSDGTVCRSSNAMNEALR